MFGGVTAMSPLLATAAPPGPIRVAADIDIDCAGMDLRQDADWYFPTGEPRGLVVLLHGFGATKDQYRELATALAAAGDLVFVPTLPLMDPSGCALSSVIPNRGFLDGLAGLLGTDGELRRSFRAAANQVGRAALALPNRMVLMGHSAGGDAVFGIAARLVTTYPSAPIHLAGLVQLDPVLGIDTSVTDDALTALASTDLPVRLITTPPSLCNNSGSATAAAKTRLPGRFLGIQLTTGSHVDALGTGDATVAAAAGLLCGTVTDRNAGLTRTFATAWARDELTADGSPDFYPGGGYYDGEAAAGEIQTLLGR